MRPLGDGMINFQLHDLLVCLLNPFTEFFHSCMSEVLLSWNNIEIKGEIFLEVIL